MKKQVTIKKDVFYCDICGKVVERNAMAPFVIVHYLTTFDDGKTREQDTEDIGCKYDLCAYHSTILGNLVRRKVLDALAFLEDEQKVKDEINKQEE